MKRALENDLSLDISEKSREHILAMFNIAKTIQLPVLENGDIVGILDLFDYLKDPDTPIDKLMETEFVVAGRTISVFSFQNQNQLILPFVEFMRVGGSTLIKVDVRIIAATNRNLEEMIKEGKFRKDLYYRLNVVPIKIPPLSQRKADVEELIEKCIARFNKAYQSDVKLTPRAQEYLMDYNWPGNVRELENIMEYLVVTSRSGWIEADDLPNTVLASQNGSAGAINLSTVNSLKEAVATLEERLLRDARNRTNSMEEMGRLLKVDRTTVMRKMKKYNIEY